MAAPRSRGPTQRSGQPRRASPNAAASGPASANSAPLATTAAAAWSLRPSSRIARSWSASSRYRPENARLTRGGETGRVQHQTADADGQRVDAEPGRSERATRLERQAAGEDRDPPPGWPAAAAYCEPGRDPPVRRPGTLGRRRRHRMSRRSGSNRQSPEAGACSRQATRAQAAPLTATARLDRHCRPESLARASGRGPSNPSASVVQSCAPDAPARRAARKCPSPALRSPQSSDSSTALSATNGGGRRIALQSGARAHRASSPPPSADPAPRPEAGESAGSALVSRVALWQHRRAAGPGRPTPTDSVHAERCRFPTASRPLPAVDG